MEKYTLASRPATPFPPNTLDKHKHPSAFICDTCVWTQSLEWCPRGWMRVEGEMQQSAQIVVTVVHLPRSTPHVACVPLQSVQWQLLRSTIESEDRREGERGEGGAVMRDCGRVAILLYTSWSP